MSKQAEEQAKAQAEYIRAVIDAYHTAGENDTATVDGETLTQDEIADRIQEHPLEVSVRSDWHSPGENVKPSEFAILLCTGGPAVRVRGDLDNYGQPSRAWMEYQGWGEPWAQYFLDHDELEALQEYVGFFWYGE